MLLCLCWAGVDHSGLFQCWCEGGGRFGGTISLYLASTCRRGEEGETERHQYCWLGSRLWPRPRQIETQHLSSERKDGCVCVWGEKRQRKRSLSKANRKASLAQVRLLCVRRWGDDKKEGGVIIRALWARDWWGRPFLPVISWLEKSGRTGKR